MPASHPTPADIQRAVFLAAVKRGVDIAQTKIIRVLGRKPPVTKVRIGCTDVDLGPTGRVRQGYTVSALFTSSDAAAVTEVHRLVSEWMHLCKDARLAAGAGGEPPVAKGKKTLYLAVQ